MSSKSAPIMIPVEQGSEAWRRWRIYGLDDQPIPGITSSIAPPIDGTSTWLTAVMLFDLLTGRRADKPPHPAMLAGQAMEPAIREQYIRDFNLSATPACLEHASRTWMRSSTDGYFDDGTSRIVQEFKWSGYRDYCDACTGIIPGKYMAQCRHHRMTAEADAVHFYALPANPNWGQPALVILEEDRTTEEELLAKEIEFLDYWTRDERPPLTKADVLWRDDDAFLNACERWVTLDHATKLLDQWKKDAQEQLTTTTTHNREESDLVKCTLVAPENGAVDWKRYAISKGGSESEADNFRKKAQGSYYKLTNKTEPNETLLNQILTDLDIPTHAS